MRASGSRSRRAVRRLRLRPDPSVRGLASARLLLFPCRLGPRACNPRTHASRHTTRTTGSSRPRDRRPARDRVGDPRCCSRWGCNSGLGRKPAYEAIVGAGRQPSLLSGISDRQLPVDGAVYATNGFAVELRVPRSLGQQGVVGVSAESRRLRDCFRDSRGYCGGRHARRRCSGLIGSDDEEIDGPQLGVS
jgi:hypothetical protein